MSTFAKQWDEVKARRVRRIALILGVVVLVVGLASAAAGITFFTYFAWPYSIFVLWYLTHTEIANEQRRNARIVAKAARSTPPKGEVG